MIVLAIGAVAMLACLLMQALATFLAARYFASIDRSALNRRPRLMALRSLASLMLVLMLGNVVQIGIWALLYRALGAVPDFETAMYFSGVTFTSLGYGDVVLQGRARLLTPLQAANGLMMFGISTALFIAMVQRSIRAWAGRHGASV
jgi:hypothetical protein